MRPAGQRRWLPLPAKKALFGGKPYPQYEYPTYTPKTLQLPGEAVVTAEMLNEQREKRLNDEKEVEEKLSAMKLELGIERADCEQGTSTEPAESDQEKSPENSVEELQKRVKDLEKLLTESLKNNIKLEIERDRAVEKYQNVVGNMRSVLDDDASIS